jgi:N-acetylmuramoyl-L-alanine amidase
MNKLPWKDARTRKAILRVCSGALACLAIAAPATAEESVTAVRFWSLADITRIAVEATGQFQFHSDRLANPDRVFFDLPGTHPQLSRKILNVIPVGDQFVRQIRVAEVQSGVTRVVLDLQAAVEVSTSQLENPDRLIIELRRPGALPVPNAGRTPVKVPEPVAEAPPQTRTFHPPARPPAVETADRRNAVQPTLDPPPTETANLPPASQSRNDPLSRVRTNVPGGPPRPPRAVASITPPPPAPIKEPVTETPPPTPPEKIGLPAKRSARDETMIRALGLKVNRIVIDAGHGGHDTGSIGPGGLYEKDLVLDIAKRVGALVEQNLGSEVVYTRPDDTFIPLERRTAIANNSHGDLFLSIHANSSTLPTAAGVETYYLNFTTSKAALEVAARENATSEKTVFELQDLLHKIALKDKVDESREFASRIQNSLNTMSSKTATRQRDRGIRKAPFVVLIGAHMPSVLAEIGFISNPQYEALMRRPDYRQKIAEALYKGLASYASTLSHFQVAQTATEPRP